MKVEEIKEELLNIHIIRWEEMPNIELYIDQVINLLDETLSNCVYEEKEGHVITKNMINNYVKHKVIPPAVNKKYNREHIAKLILVCILKSLYSITDISTMIDYIYKTDEMENEYNMFCSEIEEAVKIVFGEKNYTTDENTMSERYALKRIVYSYANKLYIDKILLKKYN